MKYSFKGVSRHGGLGEGRIVYVKIKDQQGQAENMTNQARNLSSQSVNISSQGSNM